MLYTDPLFVLGSGSSGSQGTSGRVGTDPCRRQRLHRSLDRQPIPVKEKGTPNAVRLESI